LSRLKPKICGAYVERAALVYGLSGRVGAARPAGHGAS